MAVKPNLTPRHFAPEPVVSQIGPRDGHCTEVPKPAGLLSPPGSILEGSTLCQGGFCVWDHLPCLFAEHGHGYCHSIEPLVGLAMGPYFCPAQVHPGVPGSASSPVLLPGKVGSRPIHPKELFVIHLCLVALLRQHVLRSWCSFVLTIGCGHSECGSVFCHAHASPGCVGLLSSERVPCHQRVQCAPALRLSSASVAGSVK